MIEYRPGSDRLSMLLTRIVIRIQIFKAKWSDGCHLGHVFTRLRPVEMPGIAWQNDDSTRRIRLHFATLELFAQPDVEHAGHHGVDAVFRVLVRHQLPTRGQFDPDHVGAGLRELTNEDGETDSGLKGGKRLSLYALERNRFAGGLAGLVCANHCSAP